MATSPRVLQLEQRIDELETIVASHDELLAIVRDLDIVKRHQFEARQMAAAGERQRVLAMTGAARTEAITAMAPSERVKLLRDAGHAAVEILVQASSEQRENWLRHVSVDVSDHVAIALLGDELARGCVVRVANPDVTIHGAPISVPADTAARLRRIGYAVKPGMGELVDRLRQASAIRPVLGGELHHDLQVTLDDLAFIRDIDRDLDRAIVDGAITMTANSLERDRALWIAARRAQREGMSSYGYADNGAMISDATSALFGALRVAGAEE